MPIMHLRPVWSTFHRKRTLAPSESKSEFASHLQAVQKKLRTDHCLLASEAISGWCRRMKETCRYAYLFAGIGSDSRMMPENERQISLRIIVCWHRKRLAAGEWKHASSWRLQFCACRCSHRCKRLVWPRKKTTSHVPTSAITYAWAVNHVKLNMDRRFYLYIYIYIYIFTCAQGEQVIRHTCTCYVPPQEGGGISENNKHAFVLTVKDD